MNARSFRKQQRKPFELIPELEMWLLEAVNKPTTPLTKADFARIRQRARAKTSMI